MVPMSILKFLPLVFSLFLSCFHLTLPTSFPLTVKRYPFGGNRLSSLAADPPTPPPDYHSSADYTMALIATIPLGTPPQPLEMVMDTGSEINYVTCADGRGEEPMTKSFFNVVSSTSFEELLCNRPSNCSEHSSSSSVTVKCANHVCHYSYYFADGTLSEVDLFMENITLSGSESLAGIVLGCTPKNDNRGAVGLMGMNLGKLSFMTQANIQTFSYCVPYHANPNPSSGAGIFYLGKNPHSDTFKYVNLLDTDDRPGFNNLAYTIPLTEITIGGNKIAVSDDFNSSSGCPTIIDSGSQYTSLLSTPYANLRKMITNLTIGHNMSAASSRPLDMCFDATDSYNVAEMIGDVVFGFSDNVTMTIPKERILDYVDNQGACVAIGQTPDSTMATNILGVFQQQCHWVEFDSLNRRVGFAEIASCTSGNSCG